MKHSIDNERDVDQVREEAQEAAEDLAIDNHDTRPSFGIWESLRRQASISHTQNHHPPYNTQATAASVSAAGGEAGVLDLQTMQWIPVEINHGTVVEHETPRGLEAAQQSANANETGTKNEIMLPGSQALLNHFRAASRCKYTGFWHFFYYSRGTAGRRRGRVGLRQSHTGTCRSASHG